VDIHPLEVARQLTLLEHDMFVRITPRELLHKQWAASEADQLSAFVVALIERFNTVSFWVATELMSAPVAKGRPTSTSRLSSALLCLMLPLLCTQPLFC
jgi:RasGEF domain